MPETTPELAIKQTMQALPDAKKDGAWGGSFWAEYSRNPILAPWGTRRREKELRNLYRHDDSTMIRGAFASIAKIISSTPWEITGPETTSAEAAKYYRYMAKAAQLPAAADSARPDIAYWQELFRNADFGRGWTSLCEKMVTDYLRQDGGAFIEVIAPGDPKAEPSGAISGLSVLDSLRCWPTGDPEYPVVYWNRKAEYHLIHRSRVLQFQDMPDSDEMIPGYGMSALSRAVAIAYREILMNRYIAAQLDDKPPPGMIGASGINDATMQRALQTYRRDQNGSDVSPEWGRLMWIYPTDPSIPLKLEVVQFSKPPEKFDWKVYTELDVDLLALAIGVDRQDLWQLTGGNIGSKGQSETMAQKARGKTIGLLRSEMERKFNDLLPPEFEFKWKYKDTQEELERAQIAQTWAGVATSMGSVMSPDEQRNLLANQSEEIKEVITDENGKILSVGDGDVQTAQQIADDAAAAHALELASTPKPMPDGSPASANGSGTGQPVPKRPRMAANMGGQSNGNSAQKAFQSTILDFENAFADLVKARIDGTINGQRFGILARAQLRSYGLQAFRDGLEDGGVQTVSDGGAPIPLELDEQATFNAWLVEQSAYVTAFGKTLTKGDAPNADDKASLWANKSLKPIYLEGLASADKNGVYEWVVGDTEHCEDCLRLNGQVHRYRNFISRGWIPQSDKLACKGFQCQCKLVKTSKPVNGAY